MRLRSNTDNVFFYMNAGDDGNVEQASIIFQQDGSSKWATQMHTTNHYRIYDYTAAQVVIELDDNGDMHLTPAGNISINKTTNANSILDIKQSANTYQGGLTLERSDTTASWSIYTNGSSDLNFNQGSSTRGYLDNGASVGQIDFTGQHRSLLASNSPDISTPIEDLIGLIVIADGTYQNLSGGTAPKVNEALPNVKLSETANDIRVFGVISEKEDLTDNQRSYSLGNFVSVYETEASASERLVINSLGEGGMWVCNYSGSLANGNYITTSPIKGLGMKQESNILHNFTVAKINPRL